MDIYMCVGGWVVEGEREREKERGAREGRRDRRRRRGRGQTYLGSVSMRETRQKADLDL